MATKTPVTGQPPISYQEIPGRVLDKGFWIIATGEPDPPMREKILALTYDAVARVGPSTFNVKLVCQELGISYSLINHHFGGRDELLAEATVTIYKRYVETLWQAAMEKSKPKERLRAWIDESVAWSGAASGWGAILNYPTATLEVTQIIEDKYEQEMSDWGQLNLARLLVLISDVKKNRVSGRDYKVGKVPVAALIADAGLLFLMSSIGWSVLGVAVWSAGRHLPTGRTKESRANEKRAVKIHIDRIINQIDKTDIGTVGELPPSIDEM